MKIVCISDTHERLGNMEVPEGDLLIHAGDWTHNGSPTSTLIFLTQLAEISQRFAKTVFIAGNHDRMPYKEPKLFREMLGQVDLHNASYLENESVEWEGHVIYGSPWTPEFGNWYFTYNKHHGPEFDYLEEIPDNVDILVTHGPPQGILDQTWRGEEVGCPHLRDAVYQKNPKIHVFGHIHEARGFEVHNGTVFMNVSSIARDYMRLFTIDGTGVKNLICGQLF